MKGYVKKRGDRYYAVIYEGRDPVTGKEHRSWHPAGTDRAEAERLAAKLAAAEVVRIDAVRSLTFGAYLTSQWLPARSSISPQARSRLHSRRIRLRHRQSSIGHAATYRRAMADLSSGVGVSLEELQLATRNHGSVGGAAIFGDTRRSALPADSLRHPSDRSSWLALRVGGLVDRPAEFAIHDLRALPATTRA